MHHARMFLFLLLLVGGFAAAGCDRRPEVEAALGPPPPGSDYPELLSVEAILAVEGDVPEAELEANEALLQRADSLRSRAGALSN